MDTSTDTPMEGSFASFERIVRDLRSTWILWHTLFDANAASTLEEPVEFDNRNAAMKAISPYFFKYSRWAMLNSVLGDLSRLADPLMSCGKDNLTLQRIFNETEFGARTPSRSATEHALSEALNILRSSEFRDLRNKALSHNDHEVAQGGQKPDVGIEQVRMAVEWVTVFASRISSARRGETLDLRAPIRIDGVHDEELARDAHRLASAIRTAQHHHECPEQGPE